MNICFALTNLELGGAQVFVIRLANELAKQLDRPVYVYDHWPEHRNADLLHHLDPRVKIVSYRQHPAAHWFTWKINAFLAVLRLNDQFRHQLNKKKFERFLKKQKIDILNSHMSHSDFLAAGCRLPGHCKFVPSLHGEYELLLETGTTPDHHRSMIDLVLSNAAAIIYTAEKNLEPLRAIRPSGLPRLQQINIGFSEKMFVTKNIQKKSIGLSEEDFVVGMISRGIPEKGWDTAIASVRTLNMQNEKKIKLVLIGNGSYLSKLVGGIADPNILLIQFEKNFQDYFSYYQVFDLLIFPSRFKGESIPNTVIESLYWHVPVIASHVAEIPNMLDVSTDHPAGICIPYEDGKNVSGFSSAIFMLINDPRQLKTLKSNCGKAFQRYNLESVSREYLALFSAL